MQLFLPRDVIFGGLTKVQPGTGPTFVALWGNAHLRQKAIVTPGSTTLDSDAKLQRDGQLQRF